MKLLRGPNKSEIIAPASRETLDALGATTRDVTRDISDYGGVLIAESIPSERVRDRLIASWNMNAGSTRGGNVIPETLDDTLRAGGWWPTKPGKPTPHDLRMALHRLVQECDELGALGLRPTAETVETARALVERSWGSP
ncbi:MAG: hypothetical protein ACF8XB_01130 [Planctomycetota bacterium JB042]